MKGRSMSEKVFCEHCGQLIEDDEFYSVRMDDGGTELWCHDCIGEAHWCDHCESFHASDTNEVVVRGYSPYSYVYEHWCEACVEDDAIQCEDCDTLFSCYHNAIEERRVWGSGYRHICDSCYCDDYYTCQDCGITIHSDDAVFDTWDDAYCPDCYHAESENVQEYGHTSGDVFWFDDGSRRSCYALTSEQSSMLFLGIELETDGNDDRGELADDLMSEYDESQIVCKKDSSLGPEGLEIVSLPMTPKLHLTSGMWENIARIVRDHGGTSYESGKCGLHIHVSRRFFVDESAIYRLDRLFHRFKSQLVNFSRRRNCDLGDWCRIGEDELHDIPSVAERKKKWASEKKWAGRYEAVNVTNSATVEIRLWRGSLNMETFRATVEFTTGLALIVNSMSDEFADQLTWSMVKVLVRFALEEHDLPHDDLDAYIKRRGL